MSSIPTFQLPRDGSTYLRAILDRAGDLISTGIWAGLHITELKSWMSNFNTDEERYFAACILDQLIYRSGDQTMALIEQLFSRIVPDLTRQYPSPLGSLNGLPDILRARKDPGLRIVAALKSQDRPSKSANLICRHLKRHFSMKENWLITPAEMPNAVKKGISTFLFVDDFLGTGNQFSKILTDASIDNSYLSGLYVAYLPLTAHQKGIDRLSQDFPNLKVRCVEGLDETHDVFGKTSTCFDDQVNSPEVAQEFYLKFLRKRKLNISKQNRRGFGDLGLIYIFEHAVPDNSLPILWWNDDGWTRLFAR